MKERKEFDDLIFSGRNREYGAYMLRRRYNSVLIKSTAIAVIIASLVILIPYIRVLQKSHRAVEDRSVRYISVQMDDLKTPPEEELFVPAAPPPPSAGPPPVKYIAPVIVDTVLPTEKALPTVAEVQASPENTNEEIQVSTSASESELVGDPTGEGGDEPFILVEVKPTFRGGDIEKFREWIQKRVVYPQDAQDNGIQGRVYLTFVVERDGSVSNVTIVRGVDKLLDDEAVKAIQASPKWSPGLQRGRPVRVRFSMFLNFTL